VKKCNFQFSISPGSAEALVRLGGENKAPFIAYFLSNISVKNYQDRFMYVKDRVRQSSDIFETQYI